jgi:uncharacterized membrane protein YkoI
VKATRNTIRALALGAFLLAAAAIGVALWLADDEVLVTIDEVPPPARAAILKESENGSIRKIELKAEGGRQVYAAEIIVGSTKIELEVAADGTVLDRDEEDYAGEGVEEEAVALDDAPPAVREAILKEAKGAEITELERKRRAGKPVYAAEFLEGGKEIEIWVAEDGALISREEGEPE